MAALEAAFRISEPLEGCFAMPEETETTQPEAEVEETVEETVTDASDTTEEPLADDAALEAEPAGTEEPFDRARAEAKIRKANAEAANLRKRLKEAEPLLAELQQRKDSEKSESERLSDQLTRAQEQIDATRRRLVTAQVRAFAGTGSGERPAFADPEDAVGALDLGSYIDSDGDIDEAAIQTDLDALLERKPHWAKAAPPPEGPRRPAPDRTQASGANKTRTLDPAEEFAGFLKAQLK